jgi:circadian clock protein KaiC
MKKQNAAAKRNASSKNASESAKVAIRQLPTGVRGLDEILGGGIPEFSFNIIAGTPGCGKDHARASARFRQRDGRAKPALYFTVLGEPAMKMLRYQQQFSFFDESKLGKSIRLCQSGRRSDGTGSGCGPRGDHQAGDERSVPAIVVVDSFRTVVRKVTNGAPARLDLQNFIQRLAQFLTSWEATTFLVGEYAEDGDPGQSALHHRRRTFVALAGDGEELGGAQNADHEAARASLGARPAHDPHQRRRAAVLPQHAGNDRQERREAGRRKRRLSTGIPELDTMMGGGILEGDSLLVAGPSGTG